jgi:hypothetical protein
MIEIEWQDDALDYLLDHLEDYPHDAIIWHREILRRYMKDNRSSLPKVGFALIW